MVFLRNLICLPGSAQLADVTFLSVCPPCEPVADALDSIAGLGPLRWICADLSKELLEDGHQLLR